MEHEDACPGFKFAGVVAGIKKRPERDLGLIYAEKPATAAAVFTRNRVQAAPVKVSQARIQSGVCQAAIVNAGNANCCTGARGLADARAMTRLAAQHLGVDEAAVLVASTGVIGQPLPFERVAQAIPGLTAALNVDGLPDFATAIMTTDKWPKHITQRGVADGREFTVTGVAKGSGMICPDMATMLAFVVTDIAAEPDFLRRALAKGVERSFNRITVDGDSSTNDMLLLMASGFSGVSAATAAVQEAFETTLDDVLQYLAREIVRDGEGATKLVTVNVRGAGHDAGALAVARTIANSSLVKTALFGEDANWGRILAAAGRAGVAFDPEKVDIWFDDVRLVKGGAVDPEVPEALAARILQRPEFSVTLDLHDGDGKAVMLTCDFSIDYVKINADYRS